MQSDIEIAQSASLKPIIMLAQEKFGVNADALEPYGRYKAKISLDGAALPPRGKLILVTAISPTPAGEGKTTTTVGLGDALNRIGKKTLICIREPSLGPCFGIKGGAAGGGYSQVIPMEDINLHFTGDFHAIATAHNLLAALLDNHIFHGNELGLDSRQIHWRRVMDMNDRALRQMVIGLGGSTGGVPRETGFDIVAASEVMAIFCLSRTMTELKERLSNILIGYAPGPKKTKKPIWAHNLRAQGAMAVLLKEAFKPNLVQTLENNLALVHGGPFANIAHGCNSVVATRMALGLADYVVTEAGFGADLGLEKFIDIKCRKTDLKPDCVVLVATVRALKYQGGVTVEELTHENLSALEAGFSNIERHIKNIRQEFGLSCIVAINPFITDTAAELNWLVAKIQYLGVKAIVSRNWAEGGQGAEELAHEVAQLADRGSPGFRFLYEDSLTPLEKIRTIATRLYGASDVSADAKVLAELSALAETHGHLPVCIAKNQYSFSNDPTLRGAPSGHVLGIREIRPSLGAGFIVVICGSMTTMPGLPRTPAAERMDLNESGRVIGLS